MIKDYRDQDDRLGNHETGDDGYQVNPPVGGPARCGSRTGQGTRHRPLMMNPHKVLDRPISLRVWGIQLQTHSADDPAIDEFVNRRRTTAGPEQGAPCSRAITKTGEKPLDSD